MIETCCSELRYAMCWSANTCTWIESSVVTRYDSRFPFEVLTHRICPSELQRSSLGTP